MFPSHQSDTWQQPIRSSVHANCQLYLNGTLCWSGDCYRQWNTTYCRIRCFCCRFFCVHNHCIYDLSHMVCGQKQKPPQKNSILYSVSAHDYVQKKHIHFNLNKRCINCTGRLLMNVRKRRSPFYVWIPFFAFFMAYDLLFLVGALYKVPHGGWISLTMATVTFLFMLCWYTGRHYEAKASMVCRVLTLLYLRLSFFRLKLRQSGVWYILWCLHFMVHLGSKNVYSCIYDFGFALLDCVWNCWNICR